MKKFIFSILSALIILTACGSTDSVEGDEVLTVWAWDQYFNIPIMEKAGEIYAESHPGFQLEVIDIAQNDVKQKLHISLQSGAFDQLPDIVLLGDEYANTYLEAYPDSFVNLSDKVNYDDFSSYKKDACSLDGEAYCMPFDNGVAGMFYRLDFIEAAGYTEEDMQNLTYDEYYAICKDVYEKTGNRMVDYSIASDSLVLRMELQSAGVPYYELDNPESLLDNEALKVALETYKEPIRQDWAFETVDSVTYNAGLTNGDIGSIVEGVWIAPTIESAEEYSGKWRVAPVPRLDMDGTVNAGKTGGSSWYVLNGKGDEDLAVDFLNATFGGDVSFYEWMLNEYGALGTYIPAFDSEAYNQEVDYFGGQQIYKDFAQWSNEVINVDFGPDATTLEQILGGESLAYINDEIDVDELLQTVLTQFEAQI